MAGRHAARLPRGVLRAHAHDAVLLPGSEPPRTSAGPPRRRGAARAGRGLDDVGVALGLFVASDYDDDELAASVSFVRGELAFYASTPAYRAVLDLHGWAELGVELTRLSKAGEWGRMPELVDDDVLQTFAVVAPPDELAGRVLERYGDVVDRVSLYTSFAFRGDDGAAFRTILSEAAREALSSTDGRPVGRGGSDPDPD